LKFSKVCFPYLMVSSVMLLAGCAVEHDKTGASGLGMTYESTVKTQPDGSYYLEAEAAPLAGREGGAKRVVTSQASEFCAKQNKALNVIDLTEDSHLLVNGVARMTFSCR
jgi:hypothetical protein